LRGSYYFSLKFPFYWFTVYGLPAYRQAGGLRLAFDTSQIV
jgi:hypothetical protein